MNGDPLAGLSDWHLPDPVSWWPPAPGWWVLLVSIVLGLTTAAVWLRRWRRRRAMPRAALARLAELRANFQQDADERLFVAEVSRLLRRVALARFPRDRVAGLSGRDWLHFLDTTGGDGGFSDGPGRVLIEVSFRAQPMGQTDSDALIQVAERWIRANTEGSA